MFVRKIFIFAGTFFTIIICFAGVLVFLGFRFIHEAEDYQTVFHIEEQQGALAPSQEVQPEPKKKEYMNILFLGTDKTEEGEELLKTFRSDTIALLSVCLKTKEIKVLCIPRDTYTYVPVENKMDKINHAYAFGSKKKKAVEASMDAVNHFIQYDTVDHYFAIDMEPIPNIVDDMGGVELGVELDMKTHGANLSKGGQLLDGEKAFDYIHWRYSPDGDIGRIKRQQKFFRAMYDKMKRTDQIINSIKLVLNYDKYIQTDLSLKQMIALSSFAKNVAPGSVEYQVIPGKATTLDKVSYWMPDEAGTDAMLKNFFQQ